MKTELKIYPTHDPILRFPKLMGSSQGKVVLFTEYGVGTVVVADDSTNVGKHSDTWVMHHFEDLPKNTTVTLTQTGE